MSAHTPVQGKPSDLFMQLKHSLVKQNRLYEDPEFPAGHVVVGSSRDYYVWKRPKELFEKPRFVLDGMDKSDLFQGELKNCWFIAAAACMATAHEALLVRCIPQDQEFDRNYAGIFCFHFWRFGEVVEIIIDDKLPTQNGRLVFASNQSQPNEFWVPLFEKAFAKLYGNYKNLEGGFTNNALVDFTGGVSEMIDLRKGNRPALYDELYDMMKRSSLLGGHINGDYINAASLPNGLYSGHAYSIINLVRLKYMGNQTRLIQLRNPWGKKEWNGAWSDNSVEWAKIPKEFKDKMNMTNREDGDFWMSFDDFVNNFEFVTICHLTPESTEATFSEDKKMWNVQSFQGEWLKGFSAGGCGNPPNEDLFWKNPQFLVSVQRHLGPEKPTNMVVSLLQNSNHQNNFYINYRIYKLKTETKQLLNSKNLFDLAAEVKHQNSDYVNMREVCSRLLVDPGRYIIVPSTFNPNEATEFLLRVFTEDAVRFRAADVPTTLQQQNSPVDKEIEKVYERVTGGDDKMDAQELVNAANEILIRDGLGWTIGLETARSLLFVMDKERSGVVSLIDFRKIMKELTLWREKFKSFDKDLSGDIDTFELAQAFSSIGFTLSRKVQETIFRRYGGKKCRLTFEDFVHSCCKIVSLYDAFSRFSDDGIKGQIHMNLEEWLSTAAYY